MIDSNTINQAYTVYMSKYGNRMKNSWDYYKGKTPIKDRQPASPLKAKTHTNIHVDFMGDIIDLKQGYMGENIQLDYVGDNEKLKEQFQLSNYTTQMKTNNSQSVEYSAVEGLSHRLIYTENGELRSKNIHGWQVIYDYENDIFNPSAAYYFFSKQGITDTEPTNYCNVYDDKIVYYYEQEKKKKGIIGSDTGQANYNLTDEQPHNFNRVPIIPFLNNGEFEGNCDQAFGLMNNYDEVISDVTGEIKAARLAYLKIFGDLYTGQDVDGEDIPIPDYLREFGTMIFGRTADGKPLGDAEFLEKHIDDTAIEHDLDRLKAHIYEVSGSIDLKELTAAERVFSIKASMIRPENNAQTTENYFILALMIYINLFIYWAQEYKNLSSNMLEYNVDIGRVFPQDQEAMTRVFGSLVMSGLSTEDALREAGYPNATQLAERADEVGMPNLGINNVE